MVSAWLGHTDRLHADEHLHGIRAGTERGAPTVPVVRPGLIVATPGVPDSRGGQVVSHGTLPRAPLFSSFVWRNELADVFARSLAMPSLIRLA